jgi:hypothetical protein
MITVKDIVQAYLIANGYDGLYMEICGCHINDLFPCNEDFSKCHPGHKQKCETCTEEDCDNRNPDDWCIRGPQ